MPNKWFWKDIDERYSVCFNFREFDVCTNLYKVSFETISHTLWLRNFISGLGVVDSIAKPMTIYCDNSATVFFSKNDKYSNSSKHMEVKYLVDRERVQKQQVSIENMSTTLMIAIPLTKELPLKTYKEHVIRICLLSNPWCEFWVVIILDTKLRISRLFLIFLFPFVCAHIMLDFIKQELSWPDKIIGASLGNVT